MSEGIGPSLFVSIGTFDTPAPGWLAMHERDDADVPFRIGDEFPFDDRGADGIACSDFVAGLARADLLWFLLECRRVLKPRGLLSLRLSHPSDDDGVARIRWGSSLAGLEAASATTVAPHCRRALAVLHDANAPGATVELTKRDRGVSGDPLVSILIPAYSPRYFAACLDSALDQTYRNLEIVICDDSSGPEIEALTHARGDDREIRYLRNPMRLHGRGNFSKCLESARGEFVKFLCDDDLLAPPCVATLLDVFRHAPDVTLATSYRRRIDEHGRRLPDQPATVPIVNADTSIAGFTLANAMVMAGLNWVGEPSTVLFRKADLLDRAPDYFQFNGVRGLGIIDLVTWSALLLKGNAVYLTQALSSFRIHAAQRQHAPEAAQRTVESIRSLQAAWLELKLADRLSPHLLFTKPFPQDSAGDWQMRPVLSQFAVRRIEHTATPARP